MYDILFQDLTNVENALIVSGGVMNVPQMLCNW